jgi:hypothetical protein
MVPSHVGSPLHVIAVCSNPAQYASRYRLFREFAARMAEQPVEFYAVEMAFGARPFEVTEAGNPRHVRVRSSTELWHKENLIQLGLRALPLDWKYVAWVDADVSFLSPTWVKDTLDALQHYQVVQLWQDTLDMGPKGEVVQHHRSFCWHHVNGTQRKPTGGYGYGSPSFWHPGFAWAARREALDGLGGLMVLPAVLGSADHHMALALINEAEDSMPGGIHPNYRQLVLEWQEQAQSVIKSNIGYVPGTLVHHWHGKKKDRRYQDRWQILVRHQFDPLRDVRLDSSGLMTLAPNRTKLRDDIRAYFRARNEDSIDLE